MYKNVTPIFIYFRNIGNNDKYRRNIKTDTVRSSQNDLLNQVRTNRFIVEPC